MNALTQLDGPFLPPKSGKAKQMVIFLHGYGSNGADLISLGDEWADTLPDAVFISPNAPESCDQWASGYQWFSIRAADGLDTKAIERAEAIQKPAAILSRFIDAQLRQWGVDESRVVVAGFSQGAMMAMYAMPRRQKACAGVIGYSGMLIDAAGLTAASIVKPPVLAIHGDADDIVPPSCLEGVRQGFIAAGFAVETVLRPGLGHGIDRFGLTRGVEFIREVFDK